MFVILKNMFDIFNLMFESNCVVFKNCFVFLLKCIVFVVRNTFENKNKFLLKRKKFINIETIIKTILIVNYVLKQTSLIRKK